MYKRYLNDVYELQNYKDKFQLKIEDNLAKKEKKEASRRRLLTTKVI